MQDFSFQAPGQEGGVMYARKENSGLSQMCVCFSVVKQNETVA